MTFWRFQTTNDGDDGARRREYFKRWYPVECEHGWSKMIDRTKNNVIGTMRHSMSCRLMQSDGQDPCDCSPVNDSTAMTADDIIITSNARTSLSARDHGAGQ